jgi:poly(hydroxyalkanoate) depolymerase family esterase
VWGDVVRTIAVLGLAGFLLVAGAAPGSAGRFERNVYVGQVYRLYVPGSGSPAAAPGPLVIALHGCGQTPDDFAAGTRLNDAAERRGLLVLYPGQGRAANPHRCWNWFEPPSRDRGEAAMLLRLIEHVTAGHRIDREHVVALGLSAGGFMAVNLACVAPDVVRGVAVAAGGPFGCGVGPLGALECMRGRDTNGARAAAACRDAMGPGRSPARASLWHGTEDRVVHVANFEALAHMFRLLHGSLTPTAERRDGAVRTVYRDQRGRAALETWLIGGMGHAWSGGDPRGTHTFPPGPPATARMLDFLLAQH